MTPNTAGKNNVLFLIMPYLRVTWSFCLEVKNLSVYPLKAGFRALFDCFFLGVFSFAVSQKMVWRMLCQIVA